MIGITDMTSDLIAPEFVEQEVEEGDRERFTHIVLEAVKTEDGEIHSIGNSVVEGSIYSTPVRALCGKVWVPGKDPKKYPLCPTCKEIAASQGWRVPAH